MPEWIGGIFVDGHVYLGAAIPAFDSILAASRPIPGLSAGTACRHRSGRTSPATCAALACLATLLAGQDVALSDDILDRIDEIVPPGTDVGTLDQAYQPPALENPSLRRRKLAPPS